MIAVFRHELSMYYHSMTAYVFGAFLLAFTGIGSLIYNINSSYANFEYVLAFIEMIFIVLVPIITMRIISEERKQKTDQLLYALPISATDIVVGKFLALMVVYAIPVLIMCIYPALFSRFGDVYLPTSYGSLLAFFLLGLALMSIGMFVSSLTESQGMAAGICVVVMLVCYFSSSLADYVSSTAAGSLIAIIVILVIIGMIIRHLTQSLFAGCIFSGICLIGIVIAYFANSSMLEGLLPSIMDQLSFFTRFHTFVNGVFDITALVYYVSVIVFFLFLCVQSLEKRRYNG